MGGNHSLGGLGTFLWEPTTGLAQPKLLSDTFTGNIGFLDLWQKLRKQEQLLDFGHQMHILRWEEEGGN